MRYALFSEKEYYIIIYKYTINILNIKKIHYTYIYHTSHLKL